MEFDGPVRSAFKGERLKNDAHLLENGEFAIWLRFLIRLFYLTCVTHASHIFQIHVLVS